VTFGAFLPHKPACVLAGNHLRAEIKSSPARGHLQRARSETAGLFKSPPH